MASTEDEERVVERMGLAKWLYDRSVDWISREETTVKNWGFTNQEGIGGTWSHPHRERDALVHYLLLTCFDILGQPGEWLDFGSWLASKRPKHIHERDEAGASTSVPANVAKTLLDQYNGIYGTKSSFCRFIDEMLSTDQRRKLLRSFQLWRSGNLCEDEGGKKKFLYAVRNAFTHRGVGTGSPDRSMQDRTTGRPVGSDIILRKDQEKPWELRVTSVPVPPPAPEWQEAGLTLWPYVLFDVLSAYLGRSTMPDTLLEVDVWGPDNVGARASIRYADFRPDEPGSIVRLAESILASVSRP